MSDPDDLHRLLEQIRSKRRTIEHFLSTARPRAERLTYVAIVSSALAAALTAGPAVGGADFVASAQGVLDLSSASGVWQPLCLLATVASVVAAITANLSKAKNSTARIVNAEVCNAELEGLATMVEFGQVPLEEAVELYARHVSRIPFVPEERRDGPHHGRHSGAR